MANPRDPEPRFADDELERTLTAWRDWRAGQTPNPLGYARAGVERSNGHRAAHVPGFAGIAAEVDTELRCLLPLFRDALRLEYMRPDLTLEAKAIALGAGSRRSYSRIIDQAKRALARRLQRKRARARHVVRIDVKR
jgi:hypothetical protein